MVALEDHVVAKYAGALDVCVKEAGRRQVRRRQHAFPGAGPEPVLKFSFHGWVGVRVFIQMGFDPIPGADAERMMVPGARVDLTITIARPWKVLWGLAW
jgi:hypothetical protein